MGYYMDAAEFNKYNGEKMEQCIQGQFCRKISSNRWIDPCDRESRNSYNLLFQPSQWYLFQCAAVPREGKIQREVRYEFYSLAAICGNISKIVLVIR